MKSVLSRCIFFRQHSVFDSLTAIPLNAVLHIIAHFLRTFWIKRSFRGFYAFICHCCFLCRHVLRLHGLPAYARHCAAGGYRRFLFHGRSYPDLSRYLTCTLRLRRRRFVLPDNSPLCGAILPS